MLRKIVSRIYTGPINLCGSPLNMVLNRKCSKENFLGVNYEPDFTEQQKEFLLEVLNKSNPDELLRYNLSKNRIKKIDAWKKKNGGFNKLTDVLEVDGLGVKMLHRLCTNIIETGNDESQEIKEKPVKTRGQVVTPALTATKINELQSVLGIYLFSTGLSWAKLEKTNNYLTDWDYVNYNTNSKKLSPTDALQIVLKVCEQLPSSDVYVFESPMSVSPSAQQSPVSVTAYAQRVQLLSMLITILSTSAQHNPAYIKLQSVENKKLNIINFEPNVFFLRHRLPARLFRTLIGTEKVSAAMTINKIVNNEKSEKGVNYSDIMIDNELKTMYDTNLPVSKEVLGQALLLSMAFMDVCVYQNPKSIRSISSNKM